MAQEVGNTTRQHYQARIPIGLEAHTHQENFPARVLRTSRVQGSGFQVPAGRTFRQASVVDNRPEASGMIQTLKAFVLGATLK
jgi:hypothetical protein